MSDIETLKKSLWTVTGEKLLEVILLTSSRRMLNWLQREEVDGIGFSCNQRPQLYSKKSSQGSWEKFIERSSKSAASKHSLVEEIYQFINSALDVHYFWCFHVIIKHLLEKTSGVPRVLSVLKIKLKNRLEKKLKKGKESRISESKTFNY